jgi:membrane protease YdiL (CAAX protease family)
MTSLPVIKNMDIRTKFRSMFLLQAYKGKNDLWRYVFVIALVIIAYIVGQVPLAIASVAAMSRNGLDENALEELQASLNFAELGLHPNLVFVLLLMMFICAMAALYIGVVRIHKRSFMSIWTARKNFDYKRFIWAFLVWIGFSILFEVFGMISDPDNYVLQFEPLSFVVLLIIVIFILPIQTSFEEVFIRGYLMQGLATLSKTPWLPLFGSSFVFGAMHMMNPEVQAFGVSTMLTYYVSIALFLGILAIIDNGLELAIGVHTATNAYGALFVTFDSSAIKTPAVYRLIEVSPGMMTVYSFLALAAFLYFAHRKYHLNWGRLSEPILPSTLIERIEIQLEVFFSFIGGNPTEKEGYRIRSWRDRWGRKALLTDGLIKPQLVFSTATSSSLEFSVPIPLVVLDSEDESDHSQEVLERLSNKADQDILKDADRVRIALSNGETIHLGLSRQAMSQIMPDWDLEWDLEVVHVVSLPKHIFNDTSVDPVDVLNKE